MAGAELMRGVAISPIAKRDARRAGVYGNVEARLRRMARRSAPVTHDFGNRRFQEFVLWLENGVVLAVAPMYAEQSLR